MPRRYLFTLNNPNQMEMGQILYFTNHEQFRFMVYQGEYGVTGTPHIQGYLEITKNQRIAWFKTNFSARAHFEPANGSSEQNIHYCSKPVNLDVNTPCMCKHCTAARLNPPNWLAVQTFGQPATDITGNGFWESVAFMIAANADDKEIIEKYPQAIANLKKIDDYRKFRKIDELENKSIPDPTKFRREIRAIWLYGASGSGKTRSIWDLFPNIYTAGEDKNGFDDYSNQKSILFDDFDPKKISFKTMLRYLDVYPVQLNCRYNNKWAYYNDIFITHIDSPNKVYAKYDVDKFTQILRRVHIVQVKMISADVREFIYKKNKFQNLSDVLAQIPYRQ